MALACIRRLIGNLFKCRRSGRSRVASVVPGRPCATVSLVVSASVNIRRFGPSRLTGIRRRTRVDRLVPFRPQVRLVVSR